jgi:ligand-binding sensor domain-containing protein
MAFGKKLIALAALRFCLLTSFCFIFFAGVGQYPLLKHYSVEDGLPSNESYQVLEDFQGNILVATDRGLSIFNGIQFKKRTADKLPASPVYFMYKSASQNIYLSTLKGLLYLYEPDSLRSYKNNALLLSRFNHPGLLVANNISESKDSLWISYNNDYNYNITVGSCVIDKEGKFHFIHRSDGIYFNLRNSFYNRQLSTTIRKLNYKVYINWPDDTVTVDSVHLSGTQGYIRRLFYKQLNGLEIFSIGRNLLIYKNRKKIAEKIFDNNVLYIETIDDHLYVGLENAGATVYTLSQSGILSELVRFLTGFSVTSVFKDSQGGTWFSTQQNGVYYHHPSRPVYLPYYGRIMAISNYQGKTFIAYRSGSLEEYNDGKLITTSDLSEIAAGDINNLSFNKQTGSPIILTEKGRVEKRNNKWTFTSDPGAIQFEQGPAFSYSVPVVAAGVHLHYSGSPKTDTFIALPKRVISSLLDSDNTLWLGTWEGLYSVSNRKLFDRTKSRKELSDRIISIKQLTNGKKIFVTLNHGIIIHDGKSISTITADKYLKGAVIYKVVSEENILWIGTDKGLFKLDASVSQPTVLHYGTESGLPSHDIREFTVANGWLYLAWANQIISLEVSRLEEKIHVSSLSMRINNLLPSSKYVLSESDKDVEVFIESVNPAFASDVIYKYQLHGYDKHIQTVLDQHVKYTNLSAGSYKFTVQAVSAKNGYALSPVRTIDIDIKPMFYNTWLFRIACAALVVFLMFILFRQRIKAVNRKNNLLIALAENQQRALVQLINPHFTFNVLNSVQSSVLSEDKLTAASTIAQFGKLIRLSMDMSRQKKVSLQKEIDFLQHYLQTEKSRAPHSFIVKISVSPELDPEELMIPTMLIQPFAENAVKHGLLSLTDREGALLISFEGDVSNKILTCTVEDNGIGRVASKVKNRSALPEHNSSGIEVTIQRLKLIHQQNKSHFYIEIFDLKDESGNVSGCKVVFTIPLLLNNPNDEMPYN